MAQGMEVTLRQNIMIQFVYVINNMFRDMMRKIESIVILICFKLLAPKVLVTVLKKTQGVGYFSRDVYSLKVKQI